MTWNKKSGFLLIEVSIALLICLVLSAMTLFNWSLLQSVAVRVELDQLYSICSFAQRSAMAQGCPVTVAFDPQARTYAALGGVHHLARGVKFGAAPDAKGPPGSPTGTIKSPITFDDNKLVFTPEGIARAGTVYLIGSDGHHSYALTSAVAHFSHLRKYSYNGHWIALS